MTNNTRRAMLTLAIALVCGGLHAPAARAAGGDEAQLLGGPQPYNDTYQDSLTGAAQQQRNLHGAQTNAAATPEQHMLTGPNMPQAQGGIGLAAAPRAARTRNPYIAGGAMQDPDAAAQQIYGGGGAPIYKSPWKTP